MTITGLLDMGTAQVVSRENGDVIGYVHAEPKGGGQLQRWLLYRDPRNAFEVRPPPAEWADLSLEEWKRRVANEWKPGYIYIWAQANVYHHGATYKDVTWTTIPTFYRLPDPVFPPVFARDYQLDPTGGKIFNVLHGTINGLAYAQKGPKNENIAEYWMLPASFQPAGRHSAVAIEAGTDEEFTPEQFIEVANRSWASGCAFVIAGCTNYQGPVAPQELEEES